MLVEGLALASVSVVIPCYRCAETIERAIHSVASQTMRPKEVILVEDGSGDNTLSILYELQKKYGDWIRVVPLSENLGVASARNIGWKLAKNTYIAFLDADDAWHPQKIEIQYQFMIANPNVVMSGHAHKRLAKIEEYPNWSIGNWTAKSISKTDILLSNRFVTPSVMLKRVIPFRFVEGKRHMEDHLLWAQIISSGLEVVKLSANLAAIYKFPYGVAGLSSQTRQMQRGEIDNYRQLSKEGFISYLTLNLLIAFASAKVIKRLIVVTSLMMLTPTARHVANYMSLTYSITGLLVVLGIAGKHSMAADVAIVQGAVLATFYVLSGDARHLVLAEKMQAEHVVFFRLVWVVPLAVLSYFMSVTIGNVQMLIATALILRRSTEWIAEPHVTEIERIDGHWPGIGLQIVLFLMLILQIIIYDQNWLIWIWALSPLFFSVKFLTQAQSHNFFLFGRAHLASTAIMGLSNYVFRIFVVGLVGKVFSGMLFPAIAIGSFVGTMFANVAGPTAIRKGLSDTMLFKGCLLLWSVIGLIIFVFSNSIFIQTLGLSMAGGAVMVIAQRARLESLKEGHTLSSDLLIHLMLVCLTPIIYYAGGLRWLMAVYLINAILAWIFYKGNRIFMVVDSKSHTRIVAFLVALLVIPIFFQLQGSLYNDSGPLGMVDSGGKISLVPLPFSLIACYIGLVLFSEDFHYSKSGILMIGSMFFILILSSVIVGHEASKLTLLVQFMLPIPVLLLGSALAKEHKLLIAKVFLYFLLAFIPLQLICTWVQGNLALTHYLYLFSVYQNYQYVPLVFVSLFAWAWIELGETHKNSIRSAGILMGIYVAAGNSILALAALLIFGLSYSMHHYIKKSGKDFFVYLLIVVSIFGYFYLNFQIASELKHEKINHGVFVGKLFEKDGKELYTSPSNTKIPINITSRLDIAKRYINGITENTETILLGHSSPPPRAEISSGHNYYLDLTYNFGVLACLPILVLVIYTIYKYTKTKNNSPVALWMLLIVLYLVLIDSNFKVTLRQPYPAVITFFLWGMLLSEINPKKNKLLS